jgi:hypothetical protein
MRLKIKNTKEFIAGLLYLFIGTGFYIDYTRFSNIGPDTVAHFYRRVFDSIGGSKIPGSIS